MYIQLTLASANIALAGKYTPQQKAKISKINEAIKKTKAGMASATAKKRAILLKARPIKAAYMKQRKAGKKPDPKLVAKMAAVRKALDAVNSRTAAVREKLAKFNDQIRALRRAAGFKSGKVVKKRRKVLPKIKPVAKKEASRPGAGKPAAEKAPEHINFSDDSEGLAPQTTSILKSLGLNKIPTGSGEKARGQRLALMEQIGANLHRFAKPEDLVTVFEKSGAKYEEVRRVFDAAGSKLQDFEEEASNAKNPVAKRDLQRFADKIDASLATLKKAVPVRTGIGKNSVEAPPSKPMDPKVAELKKTIDRMEADLDDGRYDGEDAPYDQFKARRIINNMKNRLKELGA